MPENECGRWRFLVIFEITGRDMDDAQDKLYALNVAAKKLGIPDGFVDASGPPREEAES